LSHEIRGPAGTWRGGVSMADGRQSQGAGKGEGVRSRRLPSPPCFFLEFTYASVFRLSFSIREVASGHLPGSVYLHTFIFIHIADLFHLIYVLVKTMFNFLFFTY